MNNTARFSILARLLTRLLVLSVIAGLILGMGRQVSQAQQEDNTFGPLGTQSRLQGEVPLVAAPAQLAQPASLQAGESWQGYPLYGGEMTSIVVDPFNAQTVYVGTRDSGVYKSTDGAANWQPARNGLTYYPIRSLAADPVNAGVLYAGTDMNGVWKTTNGGASWAYSGSGIDNDLVVFNIVFDPTNSSILYAGAAGGVALVAGHVYKSTNGGATWQVKDSGMPRLTNATETNGVVALTVDPSNPGILYAGTTYMGFFRTNNGGETWTAINTGLELMSEDPDYYYDASALAIDTAQSNRPTALYGGEFFAYTAGTWSQVCQEGQRPGTGIHSEHLYFHPTNANTIYAAGSTFKVSTDGGVTWEQRLGWSTSSEIVAVAFHFSTPNTVYAAANILFQYEGGVWKTTNQGANWSYLSKGITAPEILSVAVDPTDAQKIYAGTGDPSSGYFYRSTDGGQTWSRGVSYMTGGSTDYQFGQVKDLAIDPGNPQKIYLAGTSFYISTDGGQVFTEVEAVEGPTDIAIPNGVANTIYVGSTYPGNGIFKSIDGGSTWNSKDTGLPSCGYGVCSVTALAVDPSHANTLWAGMRSRGGVARTADGGDYWVSKGLEEAVEIDAIAVHPQNGNTVLVGGNSLDGKIYKTVDGGTTWRAVVENLGSVMDIMYDPRDASWVYAFTELSGVLRSSDGGNHWFPYNDGIFYPMMYQGAFGPGASPRLVGGSFGSGLYWIEPDISEPLVKFQYLPVVIHR